MLNVIAIFISLCSFYFARKSWHESNRPIIVAYIEEENNGNISTAFNLVLANTGTRPAKNIRLHTNKLQINSIFTNQTCEAIKNSIFACFSDDSQLTILKNGESLTTAFGH